MGQLAALFFPAGTAALPQRLAEDLQLGPARLNLPPRQAAGQGVPVCFAVIIAYFPVYFP